MQVEASIVYMFILTVGRFCKEESQHWVKLSWNYFSFYKSTMVVTMADFWFVTLPNTEDSVGG